MANFPWSYPLFGSQRAFQRVWAWRDFSCREVIGLRDVGVDFVGLTAGGEWWATQTPPRERLCLQGGAGRLYRDFQRDF
ncbi:MAG: hypothetical protein LBO66_05665 [Deltaproteobacteria bacterium]|nr:hypothetical protein [Deltaproteobacteria bacterium]